MTRLRADLQHQTPTPQRLRVVSGSGSSNTNLKDQSIKEITTNAAPPTPCHPSLDCNKTAIVAVGHGATVSDLSQQSLRRNSRRIQSISPTNLCGTPKACWVSDTKDEEGVEEHEATEEERPKDDKRETEKQIQSKFSKHHPSAHPSWNPPEMWNGLTKILQKSPRQKKQRQGTNIHWTSTQNQILSQLKHIIIHAIKVKTNESNRTTRRKDDIE